MLQSTFMAFLRGSNTLESKRCSLFRSSYHRQNIKILSCISWWNKNKNYPSNSGVFILSCQIRSTERGVTLVNLHPTLITYIGLHLIIWYHTWINASKTSSGCYLLMSSDVGRAPGTFSYISAGCHSSGTWTEAAAAGWDINTHVHRDVWQLSPADPVTWLWQARDAIPLPNNTLTFSLVY